MRVVAGARDPAQPVHGLDPAQDGVQAAVGGVEELDVALPAGVVGHAGVASVGEGFPHEAVEGVVLGGVAEAVHRPLHPAPVGVVTVGGGDLGGFPDRGHAAAGAYPPRDLLQATHVAPGGVVLVVGDVGGLALPAVVELAGREVEPHAARGRDAVVAVGRDEQVLPDLLAEAVVRAERPAVVAHLGGAAVVGGVLPGEQLVVDVAQGVVEVAAQPALVVALVHQVGVLPHQRARGGVAAVGVRHVGLPCTAARMIGIGGGLGLIRLARQPTLTTGQAPGLVVAVSQGVLGEPDVAVSDQRGGLRPLHRAEGLAVHADGGVVSVAAGLPHRAVVEAGAGVGRDVLAQQPVVGGVGPGLLPYDVCAQREALELHVAPRVVLQVQLARLGLALGVGPGDLLGRPVGPVAVGPGAPALVRALRPGVLGHPGVVLALAPLGQLSGRIEVVLGVLAAGRVVAGRETVLQPGVLALGDGDLGPARVGAGAVGVHQGAVAGRVDADHPVGAVVVVDGDVRVVLPRRRALDGLEHHPAAGPLVVVELEPALQGAAHPVGRTVGDPAQQVLRLADEGLVAELDLARPGGRRVGLVAHQVVDALQGLEGGVPGVDADAPPLVADLGDHPRAAPCVEEVGPGGAGRGGVGGVLADDVGVGASVVLLTLGVVVETSPSVLLVGGLAVAHELAVTVEGVAGPVGYVVVGDGAPAGPDEQHHPLLGVLGARLGRQRVEVNVGEGGGAGGFVALDPGGSALEGLAGEVGGYPVEGLAAAVALAQEEAGGRAAEPVGVGRQPQPRQQVPVPAPDGDGRFVGAGGGQVVAAELVGADVEVAGSQVDGLLELAEAGGLEGHHLQRQPRNPRTGADEELRHGQDQGTGAVIRQQEEDQGKEGQSAARGVAPKPGTVSHRGLEGAGTG
ncbi:hypothetical protein Mterra_02056 [Calidithermus terrae]|uniref:Uncharacterized protein n=1 Tax=Calidithermus terrae TaxID=1408545 RepID=A0A399EKN0_9DEIN|nr:hypothetical protein Mterra_02056 [Calidithermus terrae]